MVPTNYTVIKITNLQSLTVTWLDTNFSIYYRDLKAQCTQLSLTCIASNHRVLEPVPMIKQQDMLSL